MKTTFSHRTKILKCERCKKMFTTGYASQYHNENAKRLCPMYKAEEVVSDASNQLDS